MTFDIHYIIIIAILVFLFFIAIYLILKKYKHQLSTLQIDLLEIKKLYQQKEEELNDARNEIKLNEELLLAQKTELEILKGSYQYEKEKHWQTKQAQIKVENDLHRLKQNQ